MKNKRLYKVITCAVCAASLCLMSVPAMAGTYTSDGTGTLAVTANVGSSYEVMIPASILVLNHDENTGLYTGDYTVAAKGKVAQDERVFLRPVTTDPIKAPFIQLTGQTTAVTAEAVITQDEQTWSVRDADPLKTDAFTEKTGNITADLGSVPDTYSGDASFEFGLELDPASGITDYKGARVTAMIKRFSGKTDFAIKVINGTNEVWYIGDGAGNALSPAVQDARMADAADPSKSAYINPLADYRIKSSTLSNSVGINEYFTTIVFEKL